MRKLYILREIEDDGAVADALLAAGLEADEAELSNPVCPHCGAATMLAYIEDGQYEVVTWPELSEPDDMADAEQWFLICTDFRCQYEEQVERVGQPMGAVLFDLQQSHCAFDEHSGMFSIGPPEMKRLIRQIQELRRLLPWRKLAYLQEEAEFQYEQQMEDLRNWVNRVAAGERIRFRAADQELTGSFVAASGDHFLIEAEPDSTLLGIALESVGIYGLSLEERPILFNEETCILLTGYKEMVVIRGYHLQLCHVDRIGIYHVRCWDGVTAAALGLKLVCPGYWEGAFRRSDIEACYDSKKMVRVKGHWVEVYGRTTSEHPAVVTHDPAAAEALGLTLERTWSGVESDESVTTWRGTVTWDQVEEQDELRVYHDEPSSTGFGG